MTTWGRISKIFRYEVGIFYLNSMARFRSIVGAKGQVVIPKEVRDMLNLKPGVEVVFEVKGGVAELRAAPRGIEEFLNSVPKDRKLRRPIDLKKLILREVEEEWST